jgi:mRNA interferase HicA
MLLPFKKVDKRDFEKHLRNNGCTIVREGSRYEIWRNQRTGETSAVPRHREVKNGTVRAICLQLEIAKPPNL